ncbi:hypothetical protein EV644_113134 [Kribbella orskensis]|uniref:DUF4158 domain-containing protein n=1 Tax=Kribbella orskensis TaxID=2512216 RepID=A0ABY2BEG9_9ACTN|nr:hypothetical protein EV642_114133 [Kribbella sp. VKM Ac-2500]TCO17904.1 hypothetical protein EV644_113134 [Kribbella orskensis]
MSSSRLLTRVRSHYRWTHPEILFSLLLAEPFDFPMMRKCLLGIKHRAESPHPPNRLIRVRPGVHGGSAQ